MRRLLLIVLTLRRLRLSTKRECKLSSEFGLNVFAHNSTSGYEQGLRMVY